jgi:hypothetical protein
MRVIEVDGVSCAIRDSAIFASMILIPLSENID